MALQEKERSGRCWFARWNVDGTSLIFHLSVYCNEFSKTTESLKKWNRRLAMSKIAHGYSILYNPICDDVWRCSSPPFFGDLSSPALLFLSLIGNRWWPLWPLFWQSSSWTRLPTWSLRTWGVGWSLSPQHLAHRMAALDFASNGLRICIMILATNNALCSFVLFGSKWHIFSAKLSESFKFPSQAKKEGTGQEDRKNCS